MQELRKQKLRRQKTKRALQTHLYAATVEQYLGFGLIDYDLEYKPELVGVAFPIEALYKGEAIGAFEASFGYLPSQYALIFEGIVLGPVSWEEIQRLFREQIELHNPEELVMHECYQEQPVDHEYLRRIPWGRLPANYTVDGEDLSGQIVRVLRVTGEWVQVTHPAFEWPEWLKLKLLGRI